MPDNGIKVDLDEATDNIHIYAEWRHKELCKSIPGANWSPKESVWRVPVSWSACLALRSTFKDNLEIGPKLAAWALRERQTRIDPANALREVVATDEGDDDLYPHQRAGIDFLTTARQAILADEPGLGKTAQAIRTLKRLQEQGETVFPALVVTPNTLKRNWEREFGKWWPGVNVQVIGGTATQRRKQFEPLLNPQPDEPQAQIVVVNWESLRAHSRLASYGNTSLVKCREHGGEDSKVTAARCEVHDRELNMIDFKSVIADEAHRGKEPKTKWTRALWAASGNAEFRYALTGTPLANNVLDLWAILHWLNPTEWPGKSRWQDRLVETMINGFGATVKANIKPEAEAEFFGALNPRLRRMLKQVVLPWLPEITYERRDVEMSAKQKKAYEQLKKDMITQLESGEYLMALDPLTRLLRLLQFASSYATIEVDAVTGEQKVHLAEPSASIDAFMDDIKQGDFGTDSVAVSAVSKQLINLLSARLEKENIPHGLITGDITPDQRQAAIDDFQSGRTKFILFTAAAGGVGITLTAARWLVRLQRSWSLVDDVQVRDRVHRIGSEIHDSIIVLDYVTTGTVQERVVEALEAKGENFEEVMRDNDKLIAFLKEEVN